MRLDETPPITVSLMILHSETEASELKSKRSNSLGFFILCIVSSAFDLSFIGLRTQTMDRHTQATPIR
jgi:hypothetical protein